MRSMTGYGQATVHEGKRTITVEVRAVNQRFLEVKLNMPREYFAWESELRGAVQATVGRGKVDVSITRNGSDGNGSQVEANLELAESYLKAWRHIQNKLDVPGTIDMSFFLGRQEVVRVSEQRGEASADVPLVRTALERALVAFNRERDREGKSLGRDLLARTKHLAKLRKQIAGLVANLKPQIEARLRQRIDALLNGREVKEDRLLQEVALVAERSDVTEEIVRLEAHLEAMANLLRSDEQVGKKLDFLLQEINREFNTIASKTNDLTVTNLTMEAKAEIEKVREQSQNLE